MLTKVERIRIRIRTRIKPRTRTRIRIRTKIYIRILFRRLKTTNYDTKEIYVELVLRNKYVHSEELFYS